MYRRKFLSLIPGSLALGIYPPLQAETTGWQFSSPPLADNRNYWVSTLLKIADPVLTNLSRGRLKASMPVELNPGNKSNRSAYTHLEAFGRLLAGMAPWLELGADNTEEGKQRARYIQLTRKSLAMATDPASPDYMKFKGADYDQSIVDAAFLAQALLRAPTQLWEPLDAGTKANVLNALQLSRNIKPHDNNWLLFMAMIETFLLKAGADSNKEKIDFAVKKHMEWYKGDGVYGDGAHFHYDYYNSFVIHPMLIDILRILDTAGKDSAGYYKTVLARGVRYAALQERMISPEGTFPVTGRSLAYRFGAFHSLAQISLMRQLPAEIKPAQVRGALSAVISRMVEARGTFDRNGWLTIGFAGHQPSVAENYISTGSLYLCSVGMLPLGLPPSDPFWANPPAEWTSVKAWKGIDFLPDHAIDV
ncbi:MAG: DUF2264 domain-containing protein [Chitinophagaceae bacterium]|nr:DUF2264 domain-containing protein [Chitinophagaceae bacterium]